jgi:hypothetical protein
VAWEGVFGVYMGGRRIEWVYLIWMNDNLRTQTCAVVSSLLYVKRALTRLASDARVAYSCVYLDRCLWVPAWPLMSNRSLGSFRVPENSVLYLLYPQLSHVYGVSSMACGARGRAAGRSVRCMHMRAAATML